MPFTMLAEASTMPTVDWSTIITANSFAPLVNGIISLLPVVVSVSIPLIVIRKGWDFLKGNIYSA